MDKMTDKFNSDLNTNSLATQKDIKNYIEQLKDGLIYFFDIPEIYRLHPAIVTTERNLGIRKSMRKGYDIINNRFFVEELVLDKMWSDDIAEKEITTFFNDFSAYYEFLQGNIYENACYYKYNFSQEEIIKYSVDISKINVKSLIHDNIDSYTLEFSEIEKQQYSDAEKHKIALKKWVTKFNNCRSYDEFKRIVENLMKSNLLRVLDFLIFNFIYSNNESVFEIITQYLNDATVFNQDVIFNFVKVLCLVFDPNEVLKTYNNSRFSSNTTAKRKKAKLKSFIANLENDEIEFITNSYFDKNSHYFVCHKIGKLKNHTSVNGFMPRLVNTYRCFETFEELAEYLGNDLSNCDLSQAVLPNLVLSEYQVNEQTKLPLQYQKGVRYYIKKKYDRFKNCFAVEQTWANEYGILIKKRSHPFTYFFDFVYFLKNDLSDADLLFCDGLQHISDFSDFNLSNAVLKSNILERLGVKYELISNNVESFDKIKSNELETIKALDLEREELSFEERLKCQKIYYITDLHLLHRLRNAQCKSSTDELYVTQKIIDNLLNSMLESKRNVLLVGGDTSSNFAYFELFVRLLRSSIDERGLDIKVIFTLGNHELWDFIGKGYNNFVGVKTDEVTKMEFDRIVKKFRKIVSDNKMYLLQNNILFKYDFNNIEEICTEELKRLSKSELLNRLKKARLIMFGGLGFAGYNEEFNANQLIYRYAITRQQEIEESKKFEELYKKICTDLSDRRVVIFTHMPQKDWCSDNTQINGFIYVNGHTHRNYFYDDGDRRIYSDNQIGYYQNNCRLKYFYLEDDYDVFATYEDGVYEITRDDYIEFHRGKNINMEFNIDFYKLYMLKKNGYYMFILQSANGNLNVLNGGQRKGLAHKAVYYYYENMDKVISYIEKPLGEFSDYQKQIADEIKAIGGWGTIHGAIIDIDFYNHIYVNPIDLTITAYWASDIVRKVVFDSMPALLQSKRPDIYPKYLKQIEGKSELPAIFNNSSIVRPPQFYFETDIYRASREIKKMQKLSSNILSIWVEPKLEEQKLIND